MEMTRGRLVYHQETGELKTVVVEEAGMRVGESELQTSHQKFRT